MMTKDFILKEINRTAQANGGKALGRQRFIDETGIKEYDWKGKIWARWGMRYVRPVIHQMNSEQHSTVDIC